MPERAPFCHDGNDKLFLAVEMSLVSTLAGVPLHIHAEGLRGTGKTTVMRWAKSMFPKIQRIKDCPFQCDPKSPTCGLHSQENHTSSAWDVEEIPMPFVEIGHGAKLGTILGSIDLKRLTDPSHPEAALLPGSIPRSHRGIIFIDEINRLAETAPEITDILLSCMGTKPGKVIIEEVGLPTCEIPLRSSVWAASNPDEEPGPLDEIRKQLADRFDLVVPVERPKDPFVVEELLLSKAKGPAWDRQDQDLEKRLTIGPSVNTVSIMGMKTFGPKTFAEKALALKDVLVPKPIVTFMASLYIQRNVESLRAIESLELCVRVLSAIRDKKEVGYEELSVVVPLVLRHRVEPMALTEILKDLEVRKAACVQPKEDRPDSKRLEENQQGRKKTSTGLHDAPESCDSLKFPEHAGNDPDPSGIPGSNTDNSASCGSHGEAGGESWFQRFMRSCRRTFSASRKYAPEKGKGAGMDQTRHFTSIYPQDTNGKTAPDVTHQKDSPFSPISPPKPARPIGYLPWEEIIMPPDLWKDRLP